MRRENAKFTNMCMVYDEDRLLLVEVDKEGWSGLVFPGGHVEKGESFVESTIREVYEETGLRVKNLQLCGVKQFQDLDDNRYVVFLYKTNDFEGQLVSSSEGQASWIKREDLSSSKMVDGFEEMLAVFEDESISEMYYYKEDSRWNIKYI